MVPTILSYETYIMNNVTAKTKSLLTNHTSKDGRLFQGLTICIGNTCSNSLKVA